MRSEEIRERVEKSYEKYGWTDEQKEVFDKFIKERYANYANPKNTVCSYLDVLNSIVPKIKKPFSEITYDAGTLAWRMAGKVRKSCPTW